VTRPDEVVQVGQEVEVEVISLDRQRRRIGLSMKSLQGDPWDRVVRIFQVGQLVKGSITKLTKFGAFACLDDAPEIEGLIHISELAEHRVGHPREVVKEGEALTLRIVKIDRAQRRMGLSLKQVDAEEYLEIDLATYSNESEPVLDEIAAPTDEPTDEAAPEPEATLQPDAEDAE
jgi:small subunit ribosomal protein S1